MRVYLDHAATSPMPPAVLDAYVDALRVVGNPSSIHGAGQAARELLETGRDAVAASIGADPAEVVLTGGGTEAVNLAIKGLYWGRAPRRRIVVPDGEHHATVDAVEWLASHEGALLDRVPVDELGRIRVDALADVLGAHADDVALVTALWANNEVGTVQPVAEIAALAAAHGVPLHLDAIAAYGQEPIDVRALPGLTALSLAAHKIGGPAGVGALFLTRTAPVEPLLHGGAQQRARSGTQDAAGAAAFGVAAARAVDGLAERSVRIGRLRDRLVDGIRAAVPDAVLCGDPEPGGRLASNAHFTFPGCDGDALLFLLDLAGFAVSTGAACAAGVSEPSHVLAAMGVPEDAARGALRFTLGDDTTDDDIDALVAAVPGVVAQARAAGLSSREPTLGR
ncbi:cysteine desulfurase family protein [Pseudolysinimonas sp.]|uniref:cysteine desulfurase family protein n=1 Tax=Pseudolysinimonas sp. TaxID=2680009 RepID=UPI003F7E1337